MKTHIHFLCVLAATAMIFSPMAIVSAAQSAESQTSVDYLSFPVNLQQVLDKRILELGEKGGICIAGRVAFSDGTSVEFPEDVQVNLYEGIDEPLQMYKGGWFIMKGLSSSYYAGRKKGVIVRAFGYDPIDDSVNIYEGEITYLDFMLQKTPDEKLASIEGVVYDEHDVPMEGVTVSLSFPFANSGSGSAPHRSVTTDSTGRYAFDGLSAAEHSVTASAENYAYHNRHVTPREAHTVVDLKLYPKKTVTLDYIYQPDGSRDFTAGTLQGGILRWTAGNDGLNFSKDAIDEYDPEDLRDLELRQDQGVMYFQNFYVNGRNGFYDAGPVDLDSVVQANTGGYTTCRKECVAGHVYVVKTYEGHYAKFIVQNIE